jgi:hypothetical protein
MPRFLPSQEVRGGHPTGSSAFARWGSVPGIRGRGLLPRPASAMMPFAPLSAAETEALQAEVMQWARTVASAAGEFVGTGSRISASEARLMADRGDCLPPAVVPHLRRGYRLAAHSP